MNDLIEQIRAMSPEEKKELAAVLNDLEPKPQPGKRNLGEMPDMRPRDKMGRLLTPEEIWDRDHPLQRRPYGYYETLQVIGQDMRVKYWTDKEVDAYNKPIEETWLSEKRKLFPDAQLPPTPVFKRREKRYSDPGW